MAENQGAIRSRRWLATIVAVWLVIQMFDVLFTVSGSYELALAICVVWIVVPLFFTAPQSFLKASASALTTRGRSSILLIGFVLASFTSAVLSQDALRSAAYLLATIVTLSIEFELCAYLGHYFNLAMRWYSVLGTLAYLPFYVRGAIDGVNWGRLSVSEFEHPNHFGFVCLSIAGASLAWDNWPMRLTISGTMIAMIMAAQARVSLVCTLVALAVFGLFELKKRKAAVTSVIVMGAILIGLGVAWESLTGQISSLLLLDDPYRGFSSGLSGRVDLWRAGVDIFLQHPLLGVGFRLQDEALPGKLQVAGAIHNGFLGTLAEVGLLGAVPLFWFMWDGLRSLWREAQQNYTGSQIAFSYVCAYLVSAMAEPRLLNLANPASVIAWSFLITGGIQAQRSTKKVSHERRRPAFKPEPATLFLPRPRPKGKDWALLLKTSRDRFK